jgi:hypothetical protein
MRRLAPSLIVAAACLAVPAVAGAQGATTPVDPLAQRVDGPVSLTPQAAEALRQRVLVECGLPADQRDNLPWYFHFEYGRRLLGAGDARRAVVQLSQSVEMNPDPKAEKRMYGMWFTDYLPYFQLAEAHAQLGNWPCAANAFRLSQAAKEAELGDIPGSRVRALEDSIESQDPTKVGTACTKEQVMDPAYAAAEAAR